MQEDEGYQFWKRFDKLRNGTPVNEVAALACIDYNLIKKQRSRNAIPKTIDALKLASTLSTTVEWLVYGKDTKGDEDIKVVEKDPRLLRILKSLVRATDRRICAVEVVLGLETEGFSSSNLA